MVIVLFWLACLSPCAQAASNSVLLDVRAVKQPYNLCLAAAVSMVLGYWGVDVTPQAIADQVPVYQDGTTGRDLQRLVEQSGFRGFLIQPPFEDLLEYLGKGRPLIVSFPARGSSRHTMVLVGFDGGRRSLLLNDPADGKRRTLSYEIFRRNWEAAQRWTFLIIPR